MPRSPGPCGRGCAPRAAPCGSCPSRSHPALRGRWSRRCGSSPRPSRGRSPRASGTCSARTTPRASARCSGAIAPCSRSPSACSRRSRAPPWCSRATRSARRGATASTPARPCRGTTPRAGTARRSRCSADSSRCAARAVRCGAAGCAGSTSGPTRSPSCARPPTSASSCSPHARPGPAHACPGSPARGITSRAPHPCTSTTTARSTSRARGPPSRCGASREAPPQAGQGAVVGRTRLAAVSSTRTPGYGAADQERWVAEAPKSRARTAFERDRARIVHSSALRRLADKTQVLGPATDDFVRTRLTHTLEVAQVGRELGKALGCDPDVVDTACLAHDLGHPPFGHNGERALDQAAADIGGFEGNAQTLRLLTRLEPKAFTDDGSPVGLNLTRASLDAATKYPWPVEEAPKKPGGRPSRKFGVYVDDLPVFTWMRQGAPDRRLSIEGQVMDLADDISYSVHDVEDAVVGGRIDLAVLRRADQQAAVVAQTRQWYNPAVSDDLLGAALERLVALPVWLGTWSESRRDRAALKDMTSQLIGRFCNAA